jgi:dTDP-glucose 4,6-dehydratase
MAMPPISVADLDEILRATAPLWEEMRGERIFISGGTGFFGCWLVESFLHANRRLGLGAEATVLTRNLTAFPEKMPHLRGVDGLRFLQGDVRDFDVPSGAYRFAIHAATEASAKQMAEEPEQMRSTIVAGTARMLEFAAAAKTRKLLFTSSGAVYGPQTISHMTEEHPPAPDSVYGIGKLEAERMCTDAATSNLEIKIARCYAFLGPHLPLDAHFAAGNFLGDALAGRTIRIASDGSAVRSYLYAADLAIWLWTMLFRAPSLRPFNVGSEDSVTIRQLAETTASIVNPAIRVEVAQAADPNRLPHRYVPSTKRAQEEVGLRQTISLEEGLRRTAAWHRLK